ncbi:MAG: nicotinate-nucleotide adenylyltransferase [Chloroflexota bacterium]
MSEKRKIGVFGGTFDPIHVGHLAAVQDVVHELNLQRVLFVPNRQPPHKRQENVSRAVDRFAMVTRSIQDNPVFDLCMMEQERAGPSHIVDTMRELQSAFHETHDLCFLVGCDALPALHTWYEPDALLDEFCVVVMDRPTGHSVDWREFETRFPKIREQVTTVHVAQLDISGEDIRRRVRSGRPIRYQVLPAVEEYILAQGLYRAPGAAER